MIKLHHNNIKNTYGNYENLFNFFEIINQQLRDWTIKVIFNMIHRKIMQDTLHQDIIDLENNILQVEDKIIEFLRLNYDEGIKKSLRQLESDLKYLSILANGAPIDRIEDRMIMDFLRTHYNYFQKLSVPA